MTVNSFSHKEGGFARVTVQGAHQGRIAQEDADSVNGSIPRSRPEAARPLENGVPVVTHFYQPDDDNNTFVDHGSIALGSSPQPKPNLRNGSNSAPATEAVQAASPFMASIIGGTDLAGTNRLSNGQRLSNLCDKTLGGEGGELQRTSTEKSTWIDLIASDGTSGGEAALGSFVFPPSAETISTTLPLFHPPLSTRASPGNCTSAGVHPNASGVTSPMKTWKPPQIVSKLAVKTAARDLAVAPDGSSLWIALGDEPLTQFEVRSSNNTLGSMRSVNWVTQVYCMAVVPIPMAKQITFKCVTQAVEGAAKGSSALAGSGASQALRKRSALRRTMSAVKASSESAGPAYTLWCGLSRGHINIVDLQSYTDAGCISNAHDQTVNKIWYLENGRVWSAGRDKSLKVWDPQTHRMLRKRNIAAILSGLCYVRTTQQVWAIAGDIYIRVYEAGGNNVRVQRQAQDQAENTLKMRGDVVVIDYHQDGNFIWAGMTRSTALIDPHSYAICHTLPVTLTALVFHMKTAIVCGHGPLLLGGDCDSVAILDVTNPVEPSLLFSGFLVCAPSPLGIRLLTSPLPFAIIACRSTPNGCPTLCLFTYTELRAEIARVEDNIPPQRKVKAGPAQDSYTRAPTIYRDAGGLGSTLAGAGGGGYVSANSARAALVVNTTGVGGDAVARMRQASAAARVLPGPAAHHPNHPAAGVSAHPPSLPQQGQSQVCGSDGGIAASAEVSLTLTQMERKLEEVRLAVTMDARVQTPLRDFSKLHGELIEWMAESTGHAPLPPLLPSVVEHISREYQTPEGKALAVVFAQLRRALAAAPMTATAAGGAATAPANPATADAAPAPSAPLLATAPSPHKTDAVLVRAEDCGGRPRSSPPSEHVLAALLCEERHAHQRQLQTLHSHNRRILERLNALACGAELVCKAAGAFPRLEGLSFEGMPQQVMAAYQTYRESCMHSVLPAAMPGTSSPRRVTQSMQHHAASFERVNDALGTLILALHKAALDARGMVSGCGGSGSGSVVDPAVVTSPIDTYAFTEYSNPSTQRYAVSQHDPALAGNRLLPARAPHQHTGDGAVSPPILPPGLLLNLVKDAADAIEESLKHVEAKWCILKQSRRQVINRAAPWRALSRPSTSLPTAEKKESSDDTAVATPLLCLAADFTQATVTWDLAIVELLFHLCKEETCLLMMEALLECRTPAAAQLHSGGRRENSSDAQPVPRADYQRSRSHWLSSTNTAESRATARDTMPTGLQYAKTLLSGENGDDTVVESASLVHSSHRCLLDLREESGGHGFLAVQEDDHSEDLVRAHEAPYYISGNDKLSEARQDESLRVSMLSVQVESMADAIRTSLQEELQLYDIGTGDEASGSGKERDLLHPPLTLREAALAAGRERKERKTHPEAVAARLSGDDQDGGAANVVFTGLSSLSLRACMQIHTGRLHGMLHWGQVGVYLAAVSLNSVRELLYPTVFLTIDTSNFLVINEKLLDCASFLSDLKVYFYAVHVSLSCQRIGPAPGTSGGASGETTLFPNTEEFMGVGLDKRRWGTLLGTYIYFLQRCKLQPELFLHWTDKDAQDSSNGRISSPSTNRAVQLKKARPSHQHQAGQSFPSQPAQVQSQSLSSDAGQHPTLSSRLRPCVSQAKMLFEAAARTLEYCYNLQQRVHAIQKACRSVAAGARNEECTEGSGVVAVHRVLDADRLPAFDAGALF